MLICCIVCLHTYKSLALKGIDNRNNMLFTVHLKYKHTQKKKRYENGFQTKVYHFYFPLHDRVERELSALKVTNCNSHSISNRIF